MRLSEYRSVWVCVLFDLPVDTPVQRLAYTRFRKKLLKDGFTMLQFSVYVRHCASGENGDVHVGRVQGFVPEHGTISILTITDKQYASMITFWGKQDKAKPSRGNQLEMF